MADGAPCPIGPQWKLWTYIWTQNITEGPNVPKRNDRTKYNETAASLETFISPMAQESTTSTTESSPRHHPDVVDGKSLEMGDEIAVTIEPDQEHCIGTLLIKPSAKAPPVGNGASRFELFGFDISHVQRDHQFLVCLICLFTFSLCYGYLQELLSVHVFSRKLTLFLSTVQFGGYTMFCSLIRNMSIPEDLVADMPDKVSTKRREVPPSKYIVLALLRAVELGLTNLALAYLNYPLKTMLKSSRVITTMLTGCWLQKKTYRQVDFVTVAFMVLGIGIFLRADATSDTIVFHWFGVLLLGISNLCDGAIVNVSEGVMKDYNVCQDEFIFQVYSLATCAIAVVAAMVGELDEGVLWMSTPGTYQDFLLDEAEPAWSAPGKWAVVLLFGLSGYMALYFSQTLVKHFGALTMSITNTSRRSTTMFLSVFLFDNVLTLTHLLGIFMFAVGLVGKVLLQFSAGPQTAPHFSWLRRPILMKRKISGLSSDDTRKDSGQQDRTGLELSDGLPLYRTRRSVVDTNAIQKGQQALKKQENV
jgi:drug/metabolite transporter (DMT)-like permease